MAQRFTRAGRIVTSGASAGGTLVGAAANMRPDLFGGIYADVPFVDALNTLLDRTLPLTETSFSEFGNPIDSKDDFETIRSYSPYDNVRSQTYPPMLVVQSLNDSRVPYWEAAKWVAKLRQLKTGGNPVVLFVKMQGGHSGGSGRFDELEDVARDYVNCTQCGACELRRTQVDLVDVGLERIVGLRDDRSAEAVGLDDVGASLEVRPVDLADHVGPGEHQDVVVPPELT
mgnify:CR=1 FL=1